MCVHTHYAFPHSMHSYTSCIHTHYAFTHTMYSHTLCIHTHYGFTHYMHTHSHNRCVGYPRKIDLDFSECEGREPWYCKLEYLDDPALLSHSIDQQVVYFSKSSHHSTFTPIVCTSTPSSVASTHFIMVACTHTCTHYNNGCMHTLQCCAEGDSEL